MKYIVKRRLYNIGHFVQAPMHLTHRGRDTDDIFKCIFID